MEIGKIPPNDIEAEQAVLGSMLTDKDAVIAAITASLSVSILPNYCLICFYIIWWYFSYFHFTPLLCDDIYF